MGFKKKKDPYLRQGKLDTRHNPPNADALLEKVRFRDQDKVPVRINDKTVILIQP